RSATRAVVRPMPPGQAPGRCAALIVAKVLTWPFGQTCTMVVPVPCRFEAALKLLTSTLPSCRAPADSGTTATPYGLTSPLAGTVDAIWVMFVSTGVVRADAGAMLAANVRAVPVSTVAASWAGCSVRRRAMSALLGQKTLSLAVIR